MDDVVQRLRAGLEAGAIDLADIMDAADEIERLRHGAAVSDNCVAGNQPEIPCPRNGDVWIVLQNVNEDPSQSPVRFEFQGVFDSRDKALAACRTDRYHMGRCRLNEEAPHETTTAWLRDASYPLWDGESAPSPIASDDAAPEAKAAMPSEVQASAGVSGTGNTPEPVAWAVYSHWHSTPHIAKNKQEAHRVRRGTDWIAPRYRSPTLTEEEVEAVEWCIFQQAVPQKTAVTMRRMLERLK